MAAPVVPQSWINFEQSLAAANTTFDRIKNSSDRDQLITDVMPANQLNSISRSEILTEWAKRVDAPAAANQAILSLLTPENLAIFQSILDNRPGSAHSTSSSTGITDPMQNLDIRSQMSMTVLDPMEGSDTRSQMSTGSRTSNMSE